MYVNSALLFRIARESSEDRIHRAERHARLKAARGHRDGQRRRHRRHRRGTER